MALTADEVDMALVGNRQALQARVFVEFSMHHKRNAQKSLAEGREVHDECEYIRIVTPGDRDEVFRPVERRDRGNYPRQYAAFLANQNQDAVSGTPLTQVLWLKPAIVAELKHFHCRTLEQLADMPDNMAQKFPGVLSLRQRARDAIAEAKGAAPLAQLREELEAEKRDKAALKAQLEELAAELKALKKKGG